MLRFASVRRPLGARRSVCGTQVPDFTRLLSLQHSDAPRSLTLKTWHMDAQTIAVLFERGEKEFSSFLRLGEPSASYFRGENEFARQWNVRRERNAKLFQKLQGGLEAA
jgi:hypothetical protein